jgi:ferric-dicitrate binding protein FerR (iron transport regulator)
MNEETYTYLLIERLKGTISEQDSIQLHEWVIADPIHQNIALQIEKAWQLSFQEATEAPISIDTDADYKAIWQKIDQTETPSMMVTHQSNRTWWRAAAAILLLVTAGGLYWKLSNTTEMLRLVTAAGERKDILLADGTHIWLNENTQLEYPAQWDGTTRTVSCNGEAFFEVAKDAAHPFEVLTTLGTVRVLGTAFDVRQKADEMILEVAVRTGKVRVQPKNSTNSADLVAGDAIQYDATKQTLTRIQNPAGLLFAWQSGELIFQAMPLRDVVKTLEQHYGKTIKLSNPDIETCTFSNKYPTNLPLKAIIDDICIVFGTKSRISDTEIVLDGGKCQH